MMRLDRIPPAALTHGEDRRDARSGIQRCKDDLLAVAGHCQRVPYQHEPRRPEAEGEAGRSYPGAGKGIPPADDDPVRSPGAKASRGSVWRREDGAGEGPAV